MSPQHTFYSTIFTTKNKELAIFGKTIDQIKKKWSEFVANVGENGLFGENGAFTSLFSGKKLNNILSPETLKQFDEFKEKFNSSSLSAEALAEQMENVDQRIIDYAKTCKNGEMTTEGFKASIDTMSFSAKAGQVALQALATAGNMLLMWVISKGIELAVKGIDNLIHSAEHCKERVDELMSSYQSAISEANSNAQTVEELASKYEELSKGVNSLGENVSLTTDEYAEYNKIVNQIADMFPNLIQGYTNEGNAILSLKGNVEELRNAYKDAQQEAYNMLIVSGKDSNGNDIIKNWKNLQETGFWNKLFDFGGNDVGGDISTQEAIEQLKALSEMSAETYRNIEKVTGSGTHEQISALSDMEKAIGYGSYIYHALGIDGNVTDEEFEAARKQAKVLIQTYQAEIDSALKNVQTFANAYLMTNEDYALLDEQSKNAASIIVNSINERIASGFTKPEDIGAYVANIVDTIKNNPEVDNIKVQDALVGLFSTDLSTLSPKQAKELVDQYVSCIATALGEDELELKIRLGFEDTDTIARNYNKVIQSAAEKFSGVSLYHRSDNSEAPDTVTGNQHAEIDSESKAILEQERAVLEAFAEENSINTQDEIAFWNQCLEESETLEEAMKKYLASAFTGDVAESIVPDISSSISTIAAQLEPQFTELGKLYNEIFQADEKGNEIFSLDSIDNAALESLRKSFAEIGEEIGVSFDPEKLEPFFEVLTDGSSTADDVQSAFNDLATAYLYSTGTLEQLNNETANAIEKQLEQMGVTNAEEIVAEALRVKNEELALSKEYLAENGKELTQATDSEVLAFLVEQAEADNCGAALAALQLKKLLVNGTLLDTETDINNVMKLAQTAGIATESLAQLIPLKAAYEEAEKKGNVMTASNIALVMGKLKQDFQNEVNNFELTPGDIKFKAPDSSKSAASSSAAKQAETDWKSLLDKETDLLEKQLAANVITFREYTDKRRQIIEDYYRDGKIKAEDYYDALESMYNHRLSLYDRVVNAVTGRIDDEIDKLKDQKEETEKSYQARIDAIQEEIDALNKANDVRQKQIDLEKAQYEAERARNQRVNKVYDGEQFIYEADMENVRDAEDDLADKEFQLNISRLETQIELLKEEMENATKSLDNQIDALEAYKEKWNEISDVYQKQQDKLLAAEIMGSEWERDVLNGRLDTLQSFTEQYIALQQAQADAAVNAARIKAEAEAGNATGGNVGSVSGTKPDTKPAPDADPKSTYDVVYEGTAKTVKTFNTPSEAQSYANYMNKVHRNDEFMYYVKKYASGTDHARKGLNLVGEDGTETFIDNDGNVSLVTSPTLIPMEGGEVVKNAEETKAMLNTGNLKPAQDEEMKRLQERIRNFDFTKIDFSKYMPPLSSMLDLSGLDYGSALNSLNSTQENHVMHIDNISINCPNVTNNSGAEYIMRELERLPLDTIQFMHRRNK